MTAGAYRIARLVSLVMPTGKVPAKEVSLTDLIMYRSRACASLQVVSKHVHGHALSVVAHSHAGEKIGLGAKTEQSTANALNAKNRHHATLDL